MTDSPRQFLAIVANALVRVVALIILGLSHWGLGWLLRFLASYPVSAANEILTSISDIAFTMIYIYILWDMVCMFVPWLRPQERSESKTDNA